MNSRRTDGIFGPDLVVHGSLDGKSDLRIEGVFEGELELDGDLAVGPEASVHAPVRAGSVVVEGELRGDVEATRSVAIRPGGRLVGDVRAPRVGIDDGGALQGGIDMDFDVSEGGDHG